MRSSIKRVSGKLFRILRHLLFWIIFLLINWKLASNEFSSVQDISFFEYWKARIVFVSLVILPFYLHIFSLRYLINKKLHLIKIILILLLGLISYSIFFQLILYLLKNGISRSSIDMARDTYFIILIVSASTLYYFIKDAIITKRRLMKMEIQFLQNQIKPHFFNNELNNLLGLVRKGDKDQSEIYIKFLSEYMSFNLKSDINMMNSLKEEVNCILAYLDNIEQRISPLVKIEYTVHKPLTSLKIYPLILMTLVENAVKHSGILESEEGAIVLDIKTEHNLLIFTLENSIHLDVDGGINSTKIGLINMKKRLNLQYQDRYDLSILEKEDSYFVELTIVLDEA